MLRPIRVRGDDEAHVYEVLYRALASGVKIDHDEPVGPGASASISVEGEVLGIEVVGLEPVTLEAAKRFAVEHDLVFPDDLPGMLRDGRRRAE
jgi:hypothetical protein